MKLEVRSVSCVVVVTRGVRMLWLGFKDVYVFSCCHVLHFALQREHCIRVTAEKTGHPIIQFMQRMQIERYVHSSPGMSSWDEMLCQYRNAK